jgi:homoserine trans-succinylase
MPVTEELDQQIADFLAAEEIVITRVKKGKEKRTNIRPDILNIVRDGNEIEIELIKGSPLQVAAQLLGMDVEDVRRLGVRKTGITLRD